MSAWRRQALEAFPELREEIEEADCTPGLLIFELLAMFQEAAVAGNGPTARRVMAFITWCLEQPTKEPGNMASVAFIEKLVDEEAERPKVFPYLTDRQIADHWPLFMRRLSDDGQARFRKYVRDKHPGAWKRLPAKAR